ncbi:hypothetical protein [Streptosporangium sp. H16]|uniref:hypothetical protein n=1 Tax=Streptosporangium sp. H16 TaxID=3444184 RepID=UPI003F7B02D9
MRGEGIDVCDQDQPADPGRAILEVAGGQAPRRLVNELAATIAAGSSRVALVVGSEAISTVRHLAVAEDRPDFGETAEGDLEDRGYGAVTGSGEWPHRWS